MNLSSFNYQITSITKGDLYKFVYVTSKDGYILYKADCYYVIKDKNSEFFIKIDCNHILPDISTINVWYEKAQELFHTK